MEKTLENYFLFIRNGVSIKQFDGDGIPITRIESISNEYLNFSKLGFANIYDENYKEYYLKNGDILMSHINSQKHLGKTAIIENLDKKVIHGMNLICLRPDMKKILPEYIFYFFKTKKFKKSIVKISKKSVNQASFSVGDLKKIKIEIPTLIYQEEVVKKLNKVKKILNDKKEQIKLLDELIKSRFIEMFGDFENSTSIGDVCTIKARIGWQGLSKKEYLLSGEYRLITGVDFNNGRINFENCYYVNKERYEQDDNIKIKMGDVLVTKDGTIGKVAIVDKLDIPATLNSGVFVLRNKDNTLNNVFLVYSLLSEDFKRFIENIKIGATVPHLNQSSFVKHKIKLPPLYLQEEFSQFVEKTDKLKFEAEKSLKEMENLYESLMQKFFKQN